MAWLYLVSAGLLEILWAVAMKYSQGFTKPWPIAIVIVAGVASFGLLTLALKQLPLGTAYAVWTGIGALGTALYGMLAWGESTHPLRIVCFVCICLGIAGLKWLV